MEQKDSKVVTPPTSCKDNVVPKSDGRGWFMAPVYAKWEQLTNNNNKLKEIRTLILEFYNKIKDIDGVDEVPPDVVAMIELIIGTDVDSSGAGAPSSVKVEPSLPSNPSGFLTPFLLCKPETHELRRVLDGVVQLLNGITEIRVEIIKAININGRLEKGTPGHGLLCFFYHKMMALLAKLEIMCKLSRKNFQPTTIPELFYGSLKVPAVSAFKHLEAGFESHIHFSTFTDVETLGSMNCESLMRLASCLCFVKSIELGKSQQLKLSEIFTDLSLSSDQICETIKSYLVEYKGASEQFVNNQKKEAETSPLNQVSRETKIVQQYKSLVAKTAEFSYLMKTLRNLAEALDEAEITEDSSTELTDVIIDKQAEAELKLRSLVTLMDGQTMLVTSLVKQQAPIKVCQKARAMSFVDDTLTGIDSIMEDHTEASDAEFIQPVEFNTVTTNEGEELDEIGNSGEVFVDVVQNIDDNDVGGPYVEIDVEEKVAEVYCGVVTQLREPIKHIETKTKERERLALKKTYDNGVDSEELSDEDSEFSTPQKFEHDTLDFEKSFHKFGSASVGEGASPEMEPGPASFGIMGDLRANEQSQLLDGE